MSKHHEQVRSEAFEERGRRQASRRRREALKTKRLPFQPDFHDLERRMMPSVFTVTSVADDGSSGTLRWAIEQADSAGSLSTIDFNIGTPGSAQTIAVGSALPNITEPVFIDGWSQAGSPYSGPPLIAVDGSSAGAGANGLTLGAGSDGSTIRGLVVSDFSGAGIEVESNDSLVVGSYLGVNAAGTAAAANAYGVMIVDGATGDTIGGSAAGMGNVISGNTTDGVYINGTSTGDVVAGNFVGTNAGGTAALANDMGIAVLSSGNTVGGTAAGSGNVLSGNTLDGIALGSAATGNLLAGNLVGTDAAGTAAIPNKNDGILVPSSGNTIGGTVAAAANVISGNSGYGLVFAVAGAGGNLVEGNLVGTSADGTAALYNANGVGISSASNTIGGVSASARNVIAGASTDIYMDGSGASGNLIEGNYLGTDSAGTTVVTLGGIAIEELSGAGANTIGGSIAGAGNLVDQKGAGSYAMLLGSGDLVEGNLIDSNPSGTVALGQTYGGIAVTGSGNTIGGTSAAARNILPTDGIWLKGAASQNLVEGNISGLDVTGTIKLSSNSGIEVDGPDNTIGGTAAGSANVLAGLVSSGENAEVILTGPTSTGNLVEGNLIGTDVTGKNGFGTYAGIVIVGGATGNTIGGTATGAGNVISDSGVGVEIVGDSPGNLVEGNKVGTDITGTAALSDNTGIEVLSGSNTIGGTTPGAGNLIAGFGNPGGGNENIGTGIWIVGSSASGNLVQGNLIGTDVTGEQILNSSTHVGMDIQGAANNTIGGTAAGAGNVIGGFGQGIFITQSGASGDLVEGNFIGVDRAGTVALPNTGQGILSTLTSSDTIGGTAAGAGNVISGNGWYGIELVSSGFLVEGNLIGTNGAGTGALGNGIDGVVIESSNNTIGGTAAGAGNVISGNASDGVEITGSGATGNLAVGNFIGTDFTGTVALANGANGVEIDTSASGNTIGGTTAAARNIISGNVQSGVAIVDANDNLVEGDYIGTDQTGTIALGNDSAKTSFLGGVLLYSGSSGDTIGGLTATPGTGAGNLISGNTFAGVSMFSAGPNNLVAGNLIGTNVTGSVALGNTGATFNYGGNGVTVKYSPDNIVGEPGGGNVIAGNGLGIVNSANILLLQSSGSVVQSNLIGTDITGTIALSTTTYFGILYELGSYTIGGLTPIPGTGLGNIISGDGLFGISDATGGGSQILPTAVTIEGNIIGADPTGEHAVPNFNGGIVLSQVSQVTIGGTAAGAANLISGNFFGGNVGLYDCSNDLVEGNLIGTDFTGEGSLTGSSVWPGGGVFLVDGSTDNTIGGTTAAARNIISANDGNGVYLGVDKVPGSTSSGNVVEGNYLGTDAAGTTPLGNSSSGVDLGVGAQDNTIGGVADGAGNVISGNTAVGVEISGTGTSGNLLEGNLIGTDVTGLVAIANATGVEIDTGASNNTIGGLTTTPGTGAGNVISGNANDGVEIAGSGSTGNVVEGDLVGTDVTGTQVVANYVGVEVDSGASANTIGTNGDGINDTAERDVISGNAFAGVELTGAGTDNNVVSGDYIGTDVTGTISLGNSYQTLPLTPDYAYGAGVEINGGASDNIIGTTGQSVDDAGQRNIISGNSDEAVNIIGSGTAGNVVAGNFIGTNAAGTAALYNGDGLFLAELDSRNWIGVNPVYGPENADEGNVISGNSSGMEMFDSTGTVVAGNEIGTNAAGTAAVPNTYGVFFDGKASGNLLGTSGQDGAINDALERNVISGNTNVGVVFGSLFPTGLSSGTISGNVVAGDYIGTNAAGTAAIPNGTGVEVDADYDAVSSSGIGENTVYGPSDTDQRNVISGNRLFGILVTGSGTTGTRIEGNDIGTDAHGQYSVGNSRSGIELTGSSSNTTIGVPGASNVISGNGGRGIAAFGVAGTVIQGNFVGTDATGTYVIQGDYTNGVEVDGGSATIGGTAAGAGNVISIGPGGAAYNAYSSAYYTGGYVEQSSGITIAPIGASGGVTYALIEGNKIGTDITGTVALGNPTGITISSSSDVTIGGTAAGAGNLIADSQQDGIVLDYIASSGNLIQGNTIEDNGLQTSTGTWAGIRIFNEPSAQNAASTGDTIGGTTAAAGNLIIDNLGPGVAIDGPYASGNFVEGNFIGTNAAGAAGEGNVIGVDIEGAPSNVIQGNVIAGSSGAGILINNGASSINGFTAAPGATSNVIAGNFVGTTASGIHALSNGGAGVEVEGGASANTIGGTAAGSANVISGNTGDGVALVGAGTTGNLVAGNLIGLDVTGEVAIGNGGAGVEAQGDSSDTIGGTTGGARNIISGNAEGVLVNGPATGILVANNLVGTDVNGTNPLGNRTAGVVVSGAIGATIGGFTSLSENVISANLGDGIDVESGASGTLIQGNDIGLDLTGTLPLGNSGVGISVAASAGTTIGGTAAGAGNLVAASGAAGVSIQGAASTATAILGNLIGTDRSGTFALGNGTDGVAVSGVAGVTIGGTSAAARNVISSDREAGIALLADAAAALIEGNFIGTDASGANPLGGGTGILVDGGSSANTIGGTAAGAGNTIAYSTGVGVELDGSAGVGNTIRWNAIFSDGGLGISETSPVVAAPTLSNVVSSGGTTTVAGSFAGAASETFILDFYTLSSINASGYGEGRSVLGSATVATDSTGAASFSLTFSTPASGSAFVSSTATGPDGSTSQFSHDYGKDTPPTAVMNYTTLAVNEGVPVPFDGSKSLDPQGSTLSYQWSFGDGETATGVSPIHTYRSVGTFSATLTVNDGFGGTSTSAATIKVNDVPPAFAPRAFTPPVTFASPAPGDGFGASVASVAGNAAIGAPYDNGPSSTVHPGAVFLYDGVPADNGVSTTNAYRSQIYVFADPNPAAGDEFGSAIATVGNDLLIGAPGSSLSGPGDGVAYLFDAAPNDPTFGELLATFTLPDPDAAGQAHFGASVAAANTNAIIGAPGKDNGTGEVFLVASDPTQPNFGDLLLDIANPAHQAGAQFGAAVSGIGANLVVGSPFDSAADPDAGAVYLFSGTTGQNTATIVNPHPSSSTGFGLAVGSVGVNVLVGSPDDSAGAGSAFLYGPTGSQLFSFAQPDAGGGHFGAAVAGSGTTALIGAPDATLGTGDAGAAYLFDANPSSSIFGQPIAAEQEPTPASGDLFGGAVAFLDVDGALLIGAEGVGGSGAEAADLYQVGALLSVSATTTYATAAPNDSVIVSGTFVVPGNFDTLTASIDWGDGSTPTQLTLPPGSYAFSAPHDYASAAAARYAIGVTLGDSLGETAFAQTVVAMSDPAPSFANPGLVLSQTAIDEDGTVTATGTIVSPGGTHTNTVTIDWGDGSSSTTIVLPPGVYGFSAPHTYPNNPAGMTSKSYAISAQVTNEEYKLGAASAGITVSDVAPQFVAADLSLSEPVVTEGDTVNLAGSFIDPDPLNSYTVTIDWGDGTAPTFLSEQQGQVLASSTPGLFTLSAPHEYLQNPSGIPTGGNYGIQVTVSDGTLATSADTSIVVNEAPPSVRIGSGGASQGSGTITLTATATNPGAPQTITIGWTLTEDGAVIDTGTGDTFTFTPPPPPAVLVATAIATNSDGLSATADDQFTIVDYANATVQVSATSITVSVGGTTVATSSLAGSGEVIVQLQGSNDVVNASADPYPIQLVAGESNETLIAGSGNDLLVAGSGANSLVGGSGNDTLVSSGGDDTLVGGTGNDVFQINPGSDPLVLGSSGSNTLDFSISTQPITINLGLNNLQAQVVDSRGDTVILLGSFDQYIGSPLGNNVTANSENDLIYGGAGNNTITGGSGNDSIVGGGGNDIIYGGSGNTTITGGGGNVSIVGGGGNDIIYGGSTSSSLSGGGGNDSIVCGGGNDIIYGGVSNNTITAGGGNDIIYGGSANNTITGGGGNDIIYGGSGNTTITGGLGNDIIYGGSSGTSITSGGGNDIIYAGSGSTTITGGSGNDIIYAGSGSTTITGGGGNDIIYGGSGNTTITAGGGNDIIYGGSASASITGGSGNDSIIGGGGNDIIYGGSGNSTITGGLGNDSIVGGGGNDIIYGGSGNTTITGGGGGDTIIGGTGNDIIYGGSQSTTLTGGTGNDSIVGGGGNDIIYAGGGSNTITGGSGNDSIVGGGGNDIIYGGSGNTTITGGGGGDTIIGGTGNDIIYGGSQSTTLTGGTGNDSIVGGGGNDIIYAGGGSNTITGGSGNDSIVGGGGNDIIYGGSGNTTITGGGGNDSIVGGSGNDIIYGGSGNTTITGGSGNDSIVGGGGNDIIYGGSGNTTITGGSGNDSIVGGGGNDIIYGGAQSSTITGGSGNDSIVGGGGNDIIYGGSGNTTITGGGGNDSIVGGSGNDIIYGGAGNDTIAGGTGNATISGGGGDDVLTAGGFDSWLMSYGSTNMTLTNTTFSTGAGGGLPASVSTISGFADALLAAGPGNVMIDASGFSGGSLLLGGTGNDTLIGSASGDTVVGGAGNDSLVGGGGADTFAFNGGSSGNQTVVEPEGSNVATLDFSNAPAGVSIDLAQTDPQAVIPGTLSLTLSNAMGISDVLGSPYDDSILGNGRDNTLIGGGGQDLIAGMGGDDVLQGGLTRTILLDFDTDTTPGDHIYTTAERNQIQAELTADYSAFSYTFTQTPPSGPYTTIFFNDPELTGLEGGSSTSIDWRNLDISGSTTLTASGLHVTPPDAASVNVANLLGAAGEPAASSADFVALSVTIAAHELGHLSGLEHGDSYGPIGSGIYAGVSPLLYRPLYTGPTAADETIRHIMASGASVGETLFQAINDPFFGEREAIGLAYGEDGSPINEQASPHYTMATAQAIPLAPLVVPNTVLSGANADRVFDVTAADVVGELNVNAGNSINTDYYSFTAQAGTLINLQVMSQVLNRPQGFFDSTLTVYDASGTVIAYNDDSFQDYDSTIIDLTLPETGTYYVEVTASTKLLQPGEPISDDTGAYELFMYTFAANGDPPAGDTMYAGSGRDTLIAGPADDTIVAPNPADDVVRGSGAISLPSNAPYLNFTAGPAQTVDEGQAVTLNSSFIDPNDGDVHSYDWHVASPNNQPFVDGTGSSFSFTPGDPGIYTVTLTVKDQNGGGATTSVQVTADEVAPMLAAPATPQSAAALASVTFDLGALSVKGIGPWSATVSWGDGQTSTFAPGGSGELSLAHIYQQPGSYTISETVSDTYGGSASATFANPVVVSYPAVAATGAPTTAVAGISSTMVVATFTDPGGARPIADYSATIVWGDGTSSGGTIAYNSATATFSVAGTHTYAAPGDDSISVTISPVDAPTTTVSTAASVVPSITTTTLSESSASIVYGQTASFTAVVTGYGTPTGNVLLYQGAVLAADQVGSGTLGVVQGTDEVTFPSPLLPAGGGPYTFIAVYQGDAVHQSSTSSASSLTINPDPSAVAASVSGGTFGQTVTISATVTAVSPGSGTPTGAVDFLDTTTGNDLGSVALTGGRASLSTTILVPGSHAINVSYTGDGNFLASSGTTSTFSIGQSIVVLDPSAGGALRLSGSAAVNVGGGVFVDSSSSSALSITGAASIKASVIDVHGGIGKSGSPTLSPSPITGASAVANPLASLPTPATEGLTVYPSEALAGSSTATIKPGIYPAISVSGSAHLTLSPGLYLIEGGGFSVSGAGSVTGSGVTIVNAGSKYPTTGGTYGGISLAGSGSYDLSPPATGTYAGILLFQPADNTKAMSLGGATSGMTGTIDAPAAGLTLSGSASLNAALVVDTLSISGAAIANASAPAAPAGAVAYSPAQVRSAYGISSLALDGTGQTIAIVDAYDDPAIALSLDTFDAQFGLTAAGPSLLAQYGPASSFLTVLDQSGAATGLPSTDPSGMGTSNWEIEEALDVEWAHAIAPGAQIVLVEANSQSLADLMSAAATAAALPGVSVVSMSWGFTEGQSVLAVDEATYDSVFNVPGVTFVASTGDYGASNPEYPAFSPNVVAVGGTSLTLGSGSSYSSETGWGNGTGSGAATIGSGGGISLYEPEPSFQQGVQSTGGRTTPDVALVADPNTGAFIADSYNLDPSDSFEVVGGTSLSAPAWAGLVALVDQGRAAAGEAALNADGPVEAQQALYRLPQAAYHTIGAGNNGFSAGPGYNLVTGLGTPVAGVLVADLVAYRGPGTSYPGPGVAPLENAGYEPSTTAGAGATDIFSVFDALLVGGHESAAIVALSATGTAAPGPNAQRSGAPAASVATAPASTFVVSVQPPAIERSTPFLATATVPVGGLAVVTSPSDGGSGLRPSHATVSSSAVSGGIPRMVTASRLSSGELAGVIPTILRAIAEEGRRDRSPARPGAGWPAELVLHELSTDPMLATARESAGSVVIPAALTFGDGTRVSDNPRELGKTRNDALPAGPLARRRADGELAGIRDGAADFLAVAGFSGFLAGLRSVRRPSGESQRRSNPGR